MCAKPVNPFVPEAELACQRDFCEQNRPLLRERFGETPRAYVQVFGCQQNVSDGQHIEGLLAQMGFSFAQSPGEADLVLLNTCAVREHAEDRAVGNTGALKSWRSARPGRILALCGCMVQQPHVAKRLKESFSYVDLVCGPQALYRLPQNLHRLLTEGGRVFDTAPEEGAVAEGLPVRRTGVKGWLPVMGGCNNFCSYCVVPLVRGRERSRSPEDIIAEARQMIAEGYHEITLLGQNVNSYGATLPEPCTFAELLRRLNDLPGDFILRFMTSHPKDCTSELLAAMRDCEKVAPHLHLPVQSGSNRILKAMNRRYTREDYLALVQKAKETVPGLCLTSDIIVGFPGEQYEDFCDTLSLVEQVGYSALYTFLFSPRRGTPAEKMPDPVPMEEKKRWFNELLALQERLAAPQTAAYAGRRLRVLCEGVRPTGLCFGRTPGNVLAEFTAPADSVGRFVEIEVTETLSFMLKGRAVS